MLFFLCQLDNTILFFTVVVNVVFLLLNDFHFYS